MKLIRVGVDLAKNVFQLHGVDRSGEAVWKRRLSRAKRLNVLLAQSEPGCEIGMEACAGAHHWARELQSRGYTVRLIPPQFVKPYVKSNKNDAADAENGLTDHFRALLHGLWVDLVGLDDRVHALDRAIEKLASSNEVTRRLQQLSGVGPMVATALVATVGNAEQYPKGRQMAAALGLTPRQHSSGGKDRLLGISKRGDVYLRKLLIHGARAVVTQAKHKDDRLSRWVTSIATRRHPNVAAVALANKTTRMAWAMLRNDTDYDPDFVMD
jgi:transposase